MTVEITIGENLVTAFLSGELDHHTAAKARELIDAKLERYTPELFIMELSRISFMDSSGIGLILGRQRLAELYGGKVAIKNPSRYAEKIIKLAGLGSMILPEKLKMQ